VSAVTFRGATAPGVGDHQTIVGDLPGALSVWGAAPAAVRGAREAVLGQVTAGASSWPGAVGDRILRMDCLCPAGSAGGSVIRRG